MYHSLYGNHYRSGYTVVLKSFGCVFPAQARLHVAIRSGYPWRFSGCACLYWINISVDRFLCLTEQTLNVRVNTACICVAVMICRDLTGMLCPPRPSCLNLTPDVSSRSVDRRLNKNNCKVPLPYARANYDDVVGGHTVNMEFYSGVSVVSIPTNVQPF
jgi:hypothetical protein